ncbi:MAG: PEP-CTERM sorting domain-containing protein [Verrucomicrobiae bacterium]|nr:PEP-CTERM sorting domain-containing protein [Verrucomicrobiae bacterium]
MKKRTPQKLSSPTVRRIALPGLAGSATAAGTESAQAGIHYFNVDPDENIVSSTFSLDVDGPFGGDLTPELQFGHNFPVSNYFGNATAQAASASAFIGGFFGAGSAYRYVANPTSGVALANLNTAGTALAADPAQNFGVISNGQIGRMAFADSNGTQDFQFMDPTPGFVAFKFDDAGKPAFGWARVTISGAKGASAGAGGDTNTISVHDFAWSSDTPIAIGQVPEPSAIGLLALGAAGIGMMRRRTKSPDATGAGD